MSINKMVMPLIIIKGSLKSKNKKNEVQNDIYNGLTK